jgi:hypothetical protein
MFVSDQIGEPVASTETTSTTTVTTRVDRKYLLPEDVLDQVLSANPDGWVPETIAGIETQQYKTTYLDTPDLSLFHAARLQRPFRSKVRIRVYLDTGDSFIEVKSRNPRGETTKVREPWTGSLADVRPFLESSLPLGTPVVDRLVPTACTAYERVAGLLVDGGRMTIDRQLVVGRYDAATHRLFDERARLAIVETKSPGRSPTAIDRWLWDNHFRPRSLSKYALAIASFRPDLPMGRWKKTALQLRPIK